MNPILKAPAFSKGLLNPVRQSSGYQPEATPPKAAPKAKPSPGRMANPKAGVMPNAGAKPGVRNAYGLQKNRQSITGNQQANPLQPPSEEMREQKYKMEGAYTGSETDELRAASPSMSSAAPNTADSINIQKQIEALYGASNPTSNSVMQQQIAPTAPASAQVASKISPSSQIDSARMQV